VRQLLSAGQTDALSPLLPPVTLELIQSK